MPMRNRMSSEKCTDDVDSSATRTIDDVSRQRPQQVEAEPRRHA